MKHFWCCCRNILWGIGQCDGFQFLGVLRRQTNSSRAIGFCLVIHWGRLTHICVGNLTFVVKTMACRLVGANPLSEAMLEHYWFNILEQHSVNSNKNSNSFTQENTFGKVVCEMAAILSRPQCDKRILVFRGAGFQETVKFQCQEMARKWTRIFISLTLNSVQKGQYITRISRLLHTTIFTILVIDSNITCSSWMFINPKVHYIA